MYKVATRVNKNYHKGDFRAYSRGVTAYIHRARVHFKVKSLNEEKLKELKNYRLEYRKSDKYEHGVYILKRDKLTITIFHNKNDTYTLQIVGLSLEECEEAFFSLVEEIEAYEYEERPIYLEIFVRYREEKELAVCEALQALANIYAYKQSIVRNWEDGKKVEYVNRVQAKFGKYKLHAKTYRKKNWRRLELKDIRRHPKLEVCIYFKGQDVAKGVELAKSILASLVQFAKLSTADLLPPGEEGLNSVICISDIETVKLLYARYSRSIVEKIARRPLATRKEQLLNLLARGFNLKQSAKIMRISYRRAKAIAKQLKEEGKLLRENGKWKVKFYVSDREKTEKTPTLRARELDENIISKLKIIEIERYRLKAELESRVVIIICEFPILARCVCEFCGHEFKLTVGERDYCPYCGHKLKITKLAIWR